MAAEAHAARLHDPVAHSHALAGFLAGAVVGFVATLEAAAVIAAVVGAVALEVGTAGLATPLVIGVAATVAEVGLTVVAGGVITNAAQNEGEKEGSESLGDPTGAVAQGSPNVLINGLPAARATDQETCHSGKIAQGSKTVGINGLAAARVGDKTTCGAVISQGSGNVLIGGPTGTYLDIQSEVPSWVRWAVVVATIAVSLGSAAREIGPMLAEINETGLARALQTGAKALKTSLEEKGGGASAETSPLPSLNSAPTLYRVDGRPPNTIFNEGFQPKGSSTDLENYVNSNSPSAFVSTSKTPEIANNPDFATPGKYVYEIDSSQVSGVDVNEAYPNNPYAHEQEIAALGGIQPGAVISAKPILPSGGLGNTIPNPGYGGK